MFFFSVLADSKETDLGSMDQQTSPSADIITGVVLEPCWACLEVYPSSY